ncbi:hypothetical protein [Paraburkholderia nemoris]|uniref:hypothetical protein n=1 Tax=Paraburkholderia nemoris TaxID=2793076 RepID=UPI0038BE1650
MSRKLPARTPGWTGLGFGSLPYESSLGALWRFAWFNALSGKEIGRLAYIQSCAPLSFAGPRLQADQFQRLTVATGIGFPLPDEARMVAHRCSLACILCKRIRLCPLCAEGNYHSFWFQLPFLSVCPVHNVPLIDICQSCGARTPDYAFTDQLYGRAWHCPRCNQPLAGVEPALRDFLDQWDNAKFLAAVFAPFNQWARRVSLRGAALDCVTESQIDSWRVHYQSLLMQGAVCEVRRPPGSFCRSAPLITHCLTWCERIVPRRAALVRPAPLEEEFRQTSEASPFPSVPIPASPHKDYIRYFSDMNPAPPEDRKYYRPRSLLCYLAVLRGIRRWLIARHSIKQLDTDLCATLQFEARHIVLVRGHDVCEIAYLLMRLLCEAYPVRVTVLSRPARPQGVYRWDYANLDEAQTLRRASRAGYLALYGTLVLAINLMNVNGLFDLRYLPGTVDLDRALSVAWSTDYLRHAGMVLMPQVEDLLESFPSIKPGISAAWAKEWAGLRSVARRHS